MTVTVAPKPNADAKAADGNRQLLVLTGLLQLERRARQAATAEELGFLIVNETLGLLRYRQAALWRDGAVAALSGVPMVDRNAPYVLWLKRLFAWARATHGGPVALDAAALPPDLAGGWADWLPAHALWLPLAGAGERPAALLLARDEPWSTGEIHLLGYAADAYGHALKALTGGKRRWRLRGPGRLLLTMTLLGGAVAALATPVPQSALAPAEVIALDPTVVRAPIDGVVDRFEVQPNEAVREGQLLLVLDRTKLQNRLEVARKAYEVAEAEYRQASQQAVFDTRTNKASVAVLKGRMEQQAAEVAYVNELLARVEIRAPRAGIAIFNDVHDWIGKPVSLGERILTVADPAEAELEIRLPVADAIALDQGAEVRLFLNIDPQNVIPARLSYSGYQAEPTPEGVLAYRLKARLEGESAPPRIGLKGIAKLYGQDSPLILSILRRPLAAARQRLGL
ncbi:HlyD family efflux transporter periplasmic adaptor subunit [Azospirillum sp. SYSU D00513]|uniref:efflux RND transporter periplasmic adaptor subunit n=1 Tax=Azospirillum sp. SYSU D00513 TaxID=2812561 RepID=UPI001A96AE32|nr:HlyD family efflux transporter periplasmic adaptor subunit [Azospirillum sp. SYSU D00513]